MPTIIKLPDERAEQLRRFATARNLSIADAIGELIADAVATGKMPAELPGFKVFRDGEEVTIEATGTFSRTFARDLAASYAAQIRAITKSVTTPAKDNPFMPALDLKVLRRGSGVKLIDAETKAEKTVAPSVADDLAGLIERAAE